jgi:hypothetical protein
MEPTQELIDQLWWDKIEQSRSMTESQRLEAGAELFDYACDITRAGIRMDHPEYSDADVERELRRRLDWARGRG